MKQDTHKTFKSPNPKYRCLSVKVSEVSLATSGGILPVEGTLYSSQEFKEFFGADYRKNFSNFVYVGQGDDTPEGGTLLFAPNIPASESAQPFRTYKEFKEWYWDPILKAIVFLRDPLPASRSVINEVGAGIAQQNTYSPREIYIPGGKIGSLFTIEEYFAPTPFDVPFYETPVVSSVTYAVPGARGGFPNCLHDKLVIPNLEAGVATYVSGTVSGIGGQVNGQVFPETNITEWQPTVVSHSQSFQMGYYCVKVTVDPPDEPDTIIQS